MRKIEINRSVCAAKLSAENYTSSGAGHEEFLGDQTA